MKDNIYIIGAGAIGKALAVFLKLANRTVFLLRGSGDGGARQTARITVELPGRAPRAADVEIGTLGDLTELDGIIVLANKSYGNENLSQRLKHKTGASPIVILQNGLGVERPFENGAFAEVYRGVLFATSQLAAGGELSFKPVSASPIGKITGGGDRLDDIVERLSTTDFPFKAETDIQPVIWKKAIINSVFNSICPLLEIDNGIFDRDERALAAGRRVIAECVSIAAAKGIRLEPDEIVERLLLISRSSDGQRISTLQDIENKRETEIETLNLEIARMAEGLDQAGSVRETRLLGELVKLKSELNRSAPE